MQEKAVYELQILCSGNYPLSCFYLKHRTLRRLDSVSVFRRNLRWAQSIELVLSTGAVAKRAEYESTFAEWKPSFKYHYC
jgi:hypothetical protein